jgi:hypothetical protein
MTLLPQTPAVLQHRNGVLVRRTDTPNEPPATRPQLTRHTTYLFDDYGTAVWDLRHHYPRFKPPNGWAVSRERHREGWMRLAIEDINVNGGSAHSERETDGMVIETLYDDWGPFSEPWHIKMAEPTFELHLRRLLRPDGTVHGLSDPDDPVETDGLMAAYNLFSHSLEAEALTVGSPSFDYELIPGVGLRPRDAQRGQ